MTERQMQLRIGILVLAALVLFGGFVLSVGSRSQLFQERYSLWAAFTSAEGLGVGSPVRLAGVPVGSVTGLAFARDTKERGIRVTVSIEQRVQDQIRTDSVASIGTIGLVGDKVLEITVGSADKPVLAAGGRLQSVESPDLTALVHKGDQILDQVHHIGASLEAFLGGNEAGTRRTVDEALQALRATLVEVERGNGLLHALVYEKDGAELLSRLDRTAGTLERLVQAVEKEDGLLHGLIYTPQEETLGRLTRSLGELEALTRQAREGPGLLHALVYDPKGAELVANLARTGEEVERLVRDIHQGQGLIPALLFDPESAKILTDLQATASGARQVTGDLEAAAANARAITADLQVVAERLRRGEGTLGALIEDPTVYEDLSALLRGANRSFLLRALIRSTRESGEPEKQK
jgi:phospholipid/cholesterol/gamma-HCH transport system substrate-binding protein